MQRKPGGKVSGTHRSGGRRRCSGYETRVDGKGEMGLANANIKSNISGAVRAARPTLSLSLFFFSSLSVSSGALFIF